MENREAIHSGLKLTGNYSNNQRADDIFEDRRLDDPCNIQLRQAKVYEHPMHELPEQINEMKKGGA